MAEARTERRIIRKRTIRHRGRGAQVFIYLGKLLRMFVYQSDWKVLPMSALIAALVSLVIRKDFLFTMEGDLKGSFALVCVAIWNGCFNSIQVICRERGIIKREHRSGMHISSYVVAHMIYQALLCLAQTVLTLYVFVLMQVKLENGVPLFTAWFIVDLGITVFLVSYASDMLSLFISAVARNTTTAMTVMPFILIFQLVFSGGIFNLPAWTGSLSAFTISNYGLKCVAAQADYNSAPMVTAWNTLMKLQDNEIDGTVTVGQVLDFLADQDNPVLSQYREKEIDATTTVGEVWDSLTRSESFRAIRDREVDATFSVGEIVEKFRTDESLQAFRDIKLENTTVGQVLDSIAESLEEEGLKDQKLGSVFTVGQMMDLLQTEEVMSALKDVPLGGKFTVGQVIDMIVNNPDLQARRDTTVTVRFTVRQILDLLGEERVKEMIQRKTAQVSAVPAYERTKENILIYWGRFALFIFAFALLAVIVLEFIDKDKR